MKRRTFLKQTTLSTAAMLSTPAFSKPHQPMVEILNPRARVPVSFIIDDSTALVNMAHYGIPQFKEVFPDKYQ